MTASLLKLTAGVAPRAWFPRLHLPRPPLCRPHHSAWRMASSRTPPEISYLTQPAAAALDGDLMGELRFSVDQLMELAGLSVAAAVHTEYASCPRVLVIAGPGNNGGDGLVAARHLTHFGHQVSYPVPTNKTLYDNLMAQCENVGVQLAKFAIFEANPLNEKYDLVVDAMFGFSFRGSPRPPFDVILDALKPERDPPKIASIDIPSGWHVENGDVQGDGIRPDMLISLSAPKECARYFTGAHHYLGGRFLPPGLLKKFNLTLPPYPGSSQCVKLSGGIPVSDLQALRIEYETSGLDEQGLAPDPVEQFKLWLDEWVKLGAVREPNAMVVATCGESNIPSARVVLLKGQDHRGFVFYTNYDSKKGQQLTENSHAALCFYMEVLHRQIRVEGVVHRLSEAESEAYFVSRPREAQLGAWASQQSSVIPDRGALEERLKKVHERFSDGSQSIPKPPFWGGFVVRPLSIEFWQGREARLHDRCEFFRQTVQSDWSLRRLSP